MKSSRIFLLLGMLVAAGVMWSCSDKDEPAEEECNYIESRSNIKHITRSEAAERGYLCMDYTFDAVPPIAESDTIRGSVE